MGTAVVGRRRWTRASLLIVKICAGALFMGVVASASPATAKSRIVFPYSPCTPTSSLPGCATKRLDTTLRPYQAKTYADHGLVDAMTEQGRHARGFYITPMYLRGFGAERTANAMKRGKLDAVVIDMKDDLGQIVYPSRVALAAPQVHVLVDDPAAMVRTFHAQGIYVVARIVSFKDSRLPYVRPDLAVRIGPHAERLYAVGENWLDQYSPEVQDYLIDIALELEGFGFDEIQFDYIRFPRGYPSGSAIWLHAGDQPKSHADVIAGFLERADRALTIPISADVFGLTTFVEGDPRGLGQHIERMAQYVEAISPMMYANGMDTYFRDGHITSHVFELIQCGLQRARSKAKDIVLRPYLQAYSNGVEHMWGPDFVLEQVLAAQRAGSDGFLFWNPTMRNDSVMAAMRSLANVGTAGPTPLLAHRSPQIKAAWCPATGNLFSVPAEREGKAAGHAAARTGRGGASLRCAGACR